MFRLPSSSDFLSLGSFRLDLRIYRTSALLFYSFRIRHFRIRYIWYINFSGILVESYGTWLLFQRLDDSSKDSDIPKNVPFAFAINNRNIIFLCLCDLRIRCTHIHSLMIEPKLIALSVDEPTESATLATGGSTVTATRSRPPP